ncbi:MAG TPA: hypothetical protein VN222_13165 [Novosphingobium sp.]|nr:hypothetical protein [Novosphingobium sp.]
MNLTRDRMHTIGWGMALTICFALTMVLTFRVNAVKSQVRLADRQILALKQEKLALDTEFETRASQQQLKAFNDVDFGYQSPTAGQYLESERQLAALGKPRAPDAPAPIRVAAADGDTGQVRVMPAIVAQDQSATDAPAPPRRKGHAQDLGDRLSHVSGGERRE